jgi:hypothetical protein
MKEKPTNRERGNLCLQAFERSKNAQTLIIEI